MKLTTIIKRMEALVNASNHRSLKGTVAYRMVNNAIATGELIRPCYTSGSGRYTTNLDYTSDVIRLLANLGLKYADGNDAPRGGKPGNWIKITTKINL